MRLPHLFLDNLCFTFGSADDLNRVLGDLIDADERQEVLRLAQLSLPPVTSTRSLAAMLGINEGLIWSMLNRQQRHYRMFEIPKGRGTRSITAPRVALKVIQKWLSVRIAATYVPPDHVFGFVPHRSHLAAAATHLGANWVLSADVQNFFPSTPEGLVEQHLIRLGFGEAGAALVARLACFRGALAQGAPCSPVLSNVCFLPVDRQLADIAATLNLRLSRYADDIVFSGDSQPPENLVERLQAALAQTPWALAAHKTELAILPKRLKVHGLLVQGPTVRLTKGYRNRIRAYRHLLDAGRINANDLPRVRGHLAYAHAVDALAKPEQDGQE